MLHALRQLSIDHITYVCYQSLASGCKSTHGPMVVFGEELYFELYKETVNIYESANEMY